MYAYIYSKNEELLHIHICIYIYIYIYIAILCYSILLSYSYSINIAFYTSLNFTNIRLYARFSQISLHLAFDML